MPIPSLPRSASPRAVPASSRPHLRSTGRLLCLGLAALTLGLWTGGCDFRKLAASQTADVIRASMPSMNREYDLELARSAIPSNLKLVEGLMELLPDDPRLLAVAAEGFGGYAFGFVEEAAEQLEGKQPDRAARLRGRAREMYLRAMKYAVRWSRQDLPELGRALYKGDMAALDATLAKATKAQVPVLFWIAYNLGQAVNVGKEIPALLAALPKAERIMRRVLELDETFFHAGPHLFFASYYASRPRALGGDPARARQHFDRALALTDHRFLLAQVLYARLYAVQVQDRALFVRLLRQVIDAPTELDPDQRLPNQIAKRRARRYLAKAEELF